MVTFEQSGSLFHIEVHYENEVRVVPDAIHTLTLMLEALGTHTPLRTFTVQRRGDSEEYDYSFVSEDGRNWEQVLYVPSSEEAGMDFDTDTWRLSEFELHEPLRLHVIWMIKSLGMSSIQATWPT